jgi:hypothetical protein
VARTTSARKAADAQLSDDSGTVRAKVGKKSAVGVGIEFVQACNRLLTRVEQLPQPLGFVHLISVPCRAQGKPSPRRSVWRVTGTETLTCMNRRDTPRAENQKLFRVGNERLLSAVDDRVSGKDRVPFLCECADASCEGRVELRVEDWEGVTREPRHYLMLSGHPRSEKETVVGTLEDYDVVLKPE